MYVLSVVPLQPTFALFPLFVSLPMLLGLVSVALLLVCSVFLAGLFYTWRVASARDAELREAKKAREGMAVDERARAQRQNSNATPSVDAQPLPAQLTQAQLQQLAAYITQQQQQLASAATSPSSPSYTELDGQQLRQRTGNAAAPARDR